MSAHARYAKATIAGHPIHPMIVGFPIALYTSGLAALLGADERAPLERARVTR